MRIATHLPLLLLAAAACAKPDVAEDGAAAPDSTPRFTVGATDRCASPATDSARAVCVALRAARREGEVEPRVVEVRRDGGVFCVRTSPAEPDVVDGGTAVRVDTAGRVRALLMTDSVRSCADLPPLEGAAARERE